MAKILDEMKEELQRELNKVISKNGEGAGASIMHSIQELENMDIYGDGRDALLFRALEKIDELEKRIYHLGG